MSLNCFIKTTVCLFGLASTTLALAASDNSTNTQPAMTTPAAAPTKAPFQKKYTNKDFYDENGNFKQDVARKAFYEMFAYYDIPVTPLMEKEIWFTDFGLGDFEHVGMGGIFWINDKEHGYFSHDIYLLPGQMIPEHRHVKTDMPAKHESWLVQKGFCYNFSEIGEPTQDAPAIPESQRATTISKNMVIQKAGELVRLKKIESWHFLYAGPHGAVVSEYGCYHDNNGLRFSNTKAKM